ncbi:MAG: endopeptidase La [Candidatus Sericytochromatia bacterium]
MNSLESLQETLKIIDKKEFPKEIPLLPLKDLVMYPGMIMPLSVGRDKSIKLVNSAFEGNKLVVLVAQKDVEKDDVEEKDLYKYGTISIIHKIIKAPDESIKVVVQGLERVKIKKVINNDLFLIANIQQIKAKKEENSEEIEALLKNLISLFQKVVTLSGYLPQDLLIAAMNIDDPEKISYLIGSNVQFKIPEQQSILEQDSNKKRLENLTKHLSKELYLLELGKKIQTAVQGTLGKNQKEYFLREQLNAIKKELGEDDEKTKEISEMKIKLSKLKISEEAKKEAERELGRLEKVSTMSSEYSIIRTYLDWFFKMPWNTYTKETLDIAKADEILNKDHFGQEKLKERIIEYLSVYKLKREKAKKGETPKSPILCFVGPPGVGKTSFGKSIANALNRKFVRISLGGVRDESEIRGHRRTYIGALPGRIVQGIARGASNNALVMLDEIDKMTVSYNGDPSAALLEVLDPEQNNTFTDHYLDVPYDLSKTMFITTANTLDTISTPLRDRMEIIELGSYTVEEKMEIAKRHLITKQLKEHCLDEKAVIFKDEALLEIISKYTREAGVRNLERTIATLCRKALTKMQKENLKQVKIDNKTVLEFLKRPRYFPESEVKERTGVPGVAIGLSWTPVGGDILFIEANKTKAKRNLRLTGQLGDVMKESAQTALSYVFSNATKIGFEESIIENTEIHLHVPAGAIPKDGPSAGITMATAISSLLLNKPMKPNIGMTGEITLNGVVLPIGGVKEKVLAAHRAGVNEIILPKRNKAELEEDVPENIRKKMKFHFVSTFDEVFKIVF